MAFPAEFVERVKDASDILDVIGQYVTLKKRGANYFGVCPFHSEKTPSFSVNPAMGIFHCFGCGVGGNVISFIMQREKMNFPEAVEFLARRAGLEIPSVDSRAATSREKLFNMVQKAHRFFRQQFKQNPLPSEYLASRGFSPEIAEKMELGYAPDRWDAFASTIKSGYKDMLTAGLLRERTSGGYYDYFRNRLIFPIKNLSGRICAFGGRYLGEDDEPAKYLNSPENPIYSKSNLLYAIDQTHKAIRKAGFVYLVEGYTDLLRLLSCGIENCAAGLGTALTPQQAKLLRRYTEKVLLLYDGDIAGNIAAVKAWRALASLGLEVEIIAFPPEHDPDSYLVEFGKEGLLTAPQLSIFKFQLGKAGGMPESRAERAKLAGEMLESAAVLPKEAERSLALEEIGGIMGIPVESLLKDLTVIKQKTRPVAEESEAVPALKFVPAEFPERDFIRLLAVNAEIHEDAFTSVKPEILTNQPLKKIFTTMKSLYLKGELKDIHSVMNQFDNTEVKNFLAECAYWVTPGDPQELLNECVYILKNIAQRMKIKALNQQIREAESQGEDASELLVQYQRLRSGLIP
ncbi:MAG: DNA primase [candidate division Zixibacteria bacterium]|nr:DNA primase [Candidatus Tariuqbacter arcticus]